MTGEGTKPVGDEAFDRSVEPGVWRYAKASRATMIVDAEDYFARMQQAMLKAQKRILLVGWDFDTRIHLAAGRRWYERFKDAGFPRRLGSFLLWLARHRDGLELLILKWSVGWVQFLARPGMLWDVMRMWPKRAIDFKFNTRHPIGCSHHQKIAILDDRVAVCGGIDMTSERWDTRDHREDDEDRTTPRGTSYCPWHDATMMLEGDIARCLGELGRQRWRNAGGDELEPVESEESPWPDDLDAQFEDVEIGIARTRAEYEELSQICEIETLMLRQIAGAKKLIYFENQYLTSRKITDAIAERLKEDDPPEIVIVHPTTAEGWLEAQAMDHARDCLVHSLREIDDKDRFGIYVPFTGETPIYVHAKIAIFDDEILRIGSANLNNRSMGLDSETDLFIDKTRPANAHLGDEIRDVRVSLLAEHTGMTEAAALEQLARTGSMKAFIAVYGTRASRQLRSYEPPEKGEIEETLAGSELLDPERPDDMFEPFAKGGLFRNASPLARAWFKIRGKFA